MSITVPLRSDAGAAWGGGTHEFYRFGAVHHFDAT
jgi:hypothetical protein